MTIKLKRAYEEPARTERHSHPRRSPLAPRPRQRKSSRRSMAQGSGSQHGAPQVVRARSSQMAGIQSAI